MKNFDLQLFAEGDSATTASAEAATAADSKPAAGEGAGDKPKTGEPEPQAAKYTDADLDRIIGQKFAEWQKKQQKAVDEAQKLATMNATQKAEYERDQLRKELNTLREQTALADMSKTARKMLTDEGITISDDLLSVMVTTDAERTKAAVDGFSKAFKEAVENAVKERLRGEPPRRGTGGAVTMTKEQILAIRDPELRQKKMLENRSLFGI